MEITSDIWSTTLKNHLFIAFRRGFPHVIILHYQFRWVCRCNTTNPNIPNFFVTWTASSEFGTYSLCEQRRFRRACASAQSRQNLCCSLIQAVNQEEPSDRKSDPWPLWMAGHAQLKFVMTECSKTQIRLTQLTYTYNSIVECLALTMFSKQRVWRQLKSWGIHMHHVIKQLIYIFRKSNLKRKTSSPKGNDRSPESNVPRSNLISKNSNSSKL